MKQSGTSTGISSFAAKETSADSPHAYTVINSDGIPE